MYAHKRKGVKPMNYPKGKFIGKKFLGLMLGSFLVQSTELVNRDVVIQLLEIRLKFCRMLSRIIYIQSGPVVLQAGLDLS